MYTIFICPSQLDACINLGTDGMLGDLTAFVRRRCRSMLSVLSVDPDIVHADTCPIECPVIADMSTELLPRNFRQRVAIAHRIDMVPSLYVVLCFV